MNRRKVKEKILEDLQAHKTLLSSKIILQRDYFSRRKSLEEKISHLTSKLQDLDSQYSTVEEDIASLELQVKRDEKRLEQFFKGPIKLRTYHHLTTKEKKKRRFKKIKDEYNRLKKELESMTEEKGKENE